MAELWKDIYNKPFFDRFITSIQEVVSDFDNRYRFQKEIWNST